MSSAQSGPDAPFLETDPPHWAARGLSTVIISLFVIVGLAAAVVKVPETVAGPFVLVPERGADPLRAAREGTVAEVLVSEGRTVERGSTLFVIRSEPVGDRRADMRSLEVLSTGTAGRIRNARAEYESQRRSDELEVKRLETKLQSTDRIGQLKRKQLAVTREMADQSKKGQQQGAVGGWEAARIVLEAERLETEVEESAAVLEETRAALSRLRQDMATREVQHRELIRALEQDGEMARVRLASMKRQLTGESGAGDLLVEAPCTGSVLRLMVSTPGAVVQPGDALGEIACAGERLQVEMALGQLEVARVREGQGAKLMYDAFPYQQFGVKFGRVRWVGPATAGRTFLAAGQDREQGTFRALIDAGDSTIVVRGEARPLLVGMRGRARVVIGRRSLISYAFEPIRALRENFSDVPATPANRPAALAPARSSP